MRYRSCWLRVCPGPILLVAALASGCKQDLPGDYTGKITAETTLHSVAKLEWDGGLVRSQTHMSTQTLPAQVFATEAKLSVEELGADGSIKTYRLTMGSLGSYELSGLPDPDNKLVHLRKRGDGHAERSQEPNGTVTREAGTGTFIIHGGKLTFAVIETVTKYQPSAGENTGDLEKTQETVYRFVGERD